MPTTYDYLLLGGGTSCAYAAVKIRELDKNGAVAILGMENEPPYDRPPFTKYYLWNDAKNVDDFHSKDISFYSDSGVELILGKKAVSIDRASKTVRTEDGGEYGYGKLLYALGSEPKRPPIPGAETAWVLRTAEDSTRIRNAAKAGSRAVLVGGGYIGAELASSLAGRGCEVTLIEAGARIWSLFPSKLAADAITGELKRLGVRVVTDSSATEIRDGKSVSTLCGDRFDGDFVVLGAGASPRIDLARGAGLSIGGRGVRANRALRTSDAAIWAAGDVVEYEDSVIDGPYRVEHHLHAKGTAEHCGKCMAGEEADYEGVPYFFSDVGELSMNLRGYPELASRSFTLAHTDEPVITEVFTFADGRIAGVVDVRKDYKLQDPIMELFGALIQQRSMAARIQPAWREAGLDPALISEPV
jgi:3-phenylpropionate/trans-cinnamate dioxygenase ferredoxin reductase subunit